MVMSLAVRESGSVTAPTIVFLHGGGAAGWMWEPQVTALADYHCLVPDLPEQGQSRAVRPFTMAGAAALIADLIRARAHGGRAHVVGLSEGAQVTVDLLAVAPELVDHAIVSSALVRPIPGGQFITPGLVVASYRLFVQPFRSSEWWIRLNMRRAAGIPDRYYQQFREEFRALTAEGFAHVMVENQRFRLPAGLERVTAPTLVVAGQHEYAAMRRSVRDLTAAIPTARGYLVAHRPRLSLQAEHNWSLTTPELFNRTVRAWLTGETLPAELKAIQ